MEIIQKKHMGEYDYYHHIARIYQAYGFPTPRYDLWPQLAVNPTRPSGKPDIHHPRGAQGQALRGLGEAKVRQGRKGDGPRFDENGPGPCKLHGECAKGHIYI